jgi:hypothetical protein
MACRRASKWTLPWLLQVVLRCKGSVRDERHDGSLGSKFPIGGIAGGVKSASSNACRIVSSAAVSSSGRMRLSTSITVADGLIRRACNKIGIGVVAPSCMDAASVPGTNALTSKP